MKLFILALCVCAAAAEVHWDTSGQYRLVENKPIEYVYEIEEPANIHITGPADARYRIIGAPVPADYPLVYQYMNPVLYPGIDSRLASLVLKTTQPFVYSYKQVNA